jgi:aerobic C4-dicarboxylate transport protein
MATTRSALRSAFTTKLYLTVLVAMVAGGVLGFAAPRAGAAMQPLGTGFISLIQMLIGPVVFCAVVTGIAGAGRLAGVGRIGIKALVYFEVLSTLALIIGLIVMDVFGPGNGVHAHAASLTLSGPAKLYATTGEHTTWYAFLVNIIPTTLVSAFTSGNVLQVLLIAILFAIAAMALGERGTPLIRGVERLSEVMFGIVRLVLYTAPIGAFGAMAYATATLGKHAVVSLGYMVTLFWATGIFFVLVVFGVVARLCGLRVLPIYRYFKNEVLITLGTANYEAVMPQLMAKLERLGCPKRIVSLVVPSGYVFNGDGVCLYLGFASLYIAQAFGLHLSLLQQIALLAMFMITSKGSAGVAGAGFVILAATLSATHSVPVVGIMLILGVDRIMSTMRGLVSLCGQMLGSIVVSKWEGVFDIDQARAVLAGQAPAVDELTDAAQPVTATA